MARDQSVAPKERINIVYKPATGDAQEEKELPLKLLVVGDFTLPSDGALMVDGKRVQVEDRKPIKVDKDSFNDVLREQNVTLSITVPNKLSGKPDDELDVNLRFEKERDFTPDAIVPQVPELKMLLEIRDALKFLRGPLGNQRAFRLRIEHIVKDTDLRRRLLAELGIPEEGAGG